jgi:hypothetical protein
VRQQVTRVFGARRIDGPVSFRDVLDDSVFVDHESSAIAVTTFFVVHAVVFYGCVLDVAEDGKRDADLFGKFRISKRAVHAESKNLSIIRFEFGDISLIRLHFLRSTTGERENINSQYDILLAFEVA